MATIRILPENEAAKIAAGEVVERPASALKELLENALDAQPTQITVYIERSGRGLIRVVDNGIGMEREDARICCAPHATSKLRTISDLETLSSYGFRGEALYALDGVSRLTISTIQKDQSGLGVKFSREAGKLIAEEEIGGVAGTDVQVKDLFFNVPARQKFLKRDETEWNALYLVLKTTALSHLSIGFKVYRDGRLALNAQPVTSVKERIAQLWDYNVHPHLLDLSYEAPSGYGKISGVVTRPDFWRYSRADMLFFVNGRWVRNSGFSKAVLKAYDRALPPGKFPLTVISISLDLREVDVNVHPRKEEVLISHQRKVERAIEEAVLTSLEMSVTQEKLSHSFFKAISPSKEEVAPSLSSQEPEVLEREGLLHEGVMRLFSEQPLLVSRKPHEKKAAYETELGQAMVHETTVKGEGIREYHLLGQIFQTYILIDQKDYLLFIDQHAAHERILYERMRSGFERQEAHRLLFPEVVALSREEFRALDRSLVWLSEWGFELEKFGESSYRIITVPAQTERVDHKEFLKEVADLVVKTDQGLSDSEMRKKLYEHVHSHAACKAAIRAGDELDTLTMRRLIEDLETVENRHICIHGRPTMWRLEKQDLARKFRRS